MSPEDRLAQQDDLESLKHIDLLSWEGVVPSPQSPYHASSFFGFSPRHVALTLLVLQNTSLILTMHHSRVVPVPAGQRYLPSTAILLVEIIKLVVSLSITSYEICETHSSKSTSKIFTELKRSVLSRDSWKLVIPAGLYTLQNSLVYVAIGNLSAGTFQVTYQLKILTTVLFSILLLGKSISPRKWLALILLTIGVAIIQTTSPEFVEILSWAEMKSRLSVLLSQADALEGPAGPTVLTLANDKSVSALDGIKSENVMTSPGLSRPALNASKGILAVIAASLTSGLTGVYFEKVVKDSLASVSLWTRNVQLSFFSLFPALVIGVLWQDGAVISRSGFFVGYNWLVWTIIALQAFGGIMVAVCITYADNIAKNFAASISIVTSCIASALIFNTPITLNFTFGTCMVLLAAHLYQTRHALAQPVTAIKHNTG